MYTPELQTFLTGLNILSAAVIVNKGIFNVINHMTKKTSFPVRLSWVCMVTGALAVVIAPLFGIFFVSWTNTLIHAGIALFLLSNRRVIGTEDGKL